MHLATATHAVAVVAAGSLVGGTVEAECLLTVVGHIEHMEISVCLPSRHVGHVDRVGIDEIFQAAALVVPVNDIGLLCSCIILVGRGLHHIEILTLGQESRLILRTGTQAVATVDVGEDVAGRVVRPRCAHAPASAALCPTVSSTLVGAFLCAIVECEIIKIFRNVCRDGV